MAQLPPYVKTVSRIAAGFGICQSVTWLLLSVVALFSYLDCSFSSDDSEIAPSGQFVHTLQSYFYLNDYCPNHKVMDNIVSSYELHIWSAVLICTSGIWLIMSCSIFFYVTNANILYANVSLYLWSIITLAASSCDLALGVVFGITVSTLGDMMNEADIEAATLSELASVRAAALFLMLMAMRGIVLMMINIALVITLLYFAYLVNQTIDKYEHNIRSLGPVYAYQSNKNLREPWSTVGSEYDERPHGGQLNRAYSRAEYDNGSQIPHVKRPQDQVAAREDPYDRSFDHSDSWHQGKVVNQGQRPFSYLEEPQFFRAPAPPKVPSPVQNSTTLPPWKRRDNPSLDPGLPIPSPDYSPPQNRRLKSALKPSAY